MGLFDEDGNFVADEKVKSKEDLMIVVKEKFGNMGVGVAKDEIFAIETGDHFSPGSTQSLVNLGELNEI